MEMIEKNMGLELIMVFKIKLNNTNGMSESFMFVQVYHEKKQEQFDAYSRYKENIPIFVGNYTLYFFKDMQIILRL